MNENLTELICIVDRSGSMSVMSNEAIDGFNRFVGDQKNQPGDANLTLALFDDQYDVVFNRLPIDRVPLLTHESFVPRGSTALLDAVGRTIDDVGRRLADMHEAERPGQVIVSILTDGYENSSRHYRLADVADRIAHQRTVYGWEFVFLAANQDAIASAASISIPAADTAAYAATPTGQQAAWQCLNEAVRAKRSRQRC